MVSKVWSWGTMVCANLKEHWLNIRWCDEERNPWRRLCKIGAVDDLDNDGDKDIVFALYWARSRSVGRRWYEILEGSRVQASLESLPRDRKYDRAMPLTLSDFNGDGNTDIILAHWLRDFTSGIYNRTRPENPTHKVYGITRVTGTLKNSMLSLVSSMTMVYTPRLSCLTWIHGRPIIIVDDGGRIIQSTKEMTMPLRDYNPWVSRCLVWYGNDHRT